MAYVGTPTSQGSLLDTLASVIQGEAGNQGVVGMTAVGSVIANRANQNFNGYGGILGQILAPNQFQGQATPGPQAYSVAQNILSGNYTDPTGGALFYANPGASSASWARNLNPSNSVQIGAHYFTDNTQGIPFSGNGASTTSNDPTGSSLTIDPNGPAEFGTDPNAGNDQGTPNLGGGISSPELGTQGNNTAYLGSGQPVNITDLKGLGTDVGTAGKDVQSGAQNAATGITGTLASTINSLEQYTSSAFVIAALVVLGLILVAYGLGLFGKRTLAEAL